MRYLIPLLALALAFAASPLLTGSFGGFDPNAYPVPQDDPSVTPAGYAFSIWGLIYLALIAHGLIGLRRGDDPHWAPTRTSNRRVRIHAHRTPNRPNPLAKRRA
ncbi:hypothetical protein [Palleronia abyssalis]|uniref:Uncharacterized protein n=1 Tax=Palleronia abyssalis TaxID=1501240 RepID=A0A2R8BUE2_9RHOB|nr:hypothetical protein [Palleronia abyssalis]SPJ23760.1 hypothetical protein PAA8504_01575 [Palleronia abyssalis]